MYEVVVISHGSSTRSVVRRTGNKISCVGAFGSLKPAEGSPFCTSRASEASMLRSLITRDWMYPAHFLRAYWPQVDQLIIDKAVLNNLIVLQKRRRLKSRIL